MAWSGFLGTWGFYIALCATQWHWACDYEAQHGTPLTMERSREDVSAQRSERVEV
jgi:hypothetical protein